MGFNYTGGQEGTHAVGLAKPIGGGVVDIENVPLDQANHYLENGYYQLDTTGTQQFVGYCINQPADAEHPTGLDCTVATVTPVLFVHPQATTQVPVTPHQFPRELPHVGGSADVLFPLIVAIAGSVMVNRRKRR